MKRLTLPPTNISFVAVVPKGDQVECAVPKTKDFSLEMFCIEVSECELFSDFYKVQNGLNPLYPNVEFRLFSSLQATPIYYYCCR
jgi:hypothetical protein